MPIVISVIVEVSRRKLEKHFCVDSLKSYPDLYTNNTTFLCFDFIIRFQFFFMNFYSVPKIIINVFSMLRQSYQYLKSHQSPSWLLRDLYSAYFSFFLIGKLKNLFFALFYLFIIFYFDCHTYYTEEKL